MRLDFHNGGRTLKARYDNTVENGKTNIGLFRAVPAGFQHRPSCRVLPPELSSGGSLEKVDVYELKIPLALYKAIIRDTSISHGAFRLWHLLQDMANDNSVCWPGQRFICRTFGCNRTSVHRWLDELIDRHYIERTFGRNR